jgi:hypothetical protein
MFNAVTEDWRNSASDINFMCSVCSQRLFEAVSGVINISSYSLAADRIAWMSARSVRGLTVNKIWNVSASFAKTSHPDRWTCDLFNFSLRTHRNMSSDHESVSGLFRNGRQLNSKLLLATVLSVVEILTMWKNVWMHTHIFVFRKYWEVH